MPELPEVETVRQTLTQLVLNKTIKEVKVSLPRIVRSPLLEDFENILPGKSITAIDRRGKFLLFRLSGGWTLISHLRMEGNYGVFASSEPVVKHTHVIFVFDDGTELRYRDVRQFGTMDLMKTDEVDNRPPINKLGPEPFAEDWTSDVFYKKLKSKKKNIKAALLDQEVVAGVGNIYADEILFRSKVAPMVVAADLSKQKAKSIYENTKQVLAEAIEAGGSSVKSYVNGQGKMGMFQQQLFVYQKHGQPCTVCGREILKTRVAGRGTHYCSKCQKS
ncbi:DNA-formamidopyrimidine glycosylase [Desulfuribacillus alkaliarsenatis]|uniref:Formamidopyrimidine-DNA glycosylase n=1 Tax=Desulfuribacillus alkaliarsenatis TaxID=766136 RepID=A0A1E5FYS9_9FIRM|nr:DNA-formamidopyrimidine glycosylase [Desulfuribacillus alkaliarsenatis]OEF95597.1 DNA-formamidopyrimidine glycosylase [Desulfuribacillus alkaliarsenatis]